MMLTIGQFAELAGVSSRTIRFYESLNLIPSSQRHENNYRYYDKSQVLIVKKIRSLQDLGFSLDEIRQVIQTTDAELKNQLFLQLKKTESEAQILEERQQKIKTLLSVSNKIEFGEFLTKKERGVYMDHIQSELQEGLKQQYKQIDKKVSDYLSRDRWMQEQPEVQDFLIAAQKCIEFAKKNNLALGPARGSASSSLTFFGLGLTKADPMNYDMIPERLATQTPFFHVDVEYERGQEFVNYCNELNHQLKFGEIQAFKMPLLDIINGVHKKIGSKINYNSIDSDSEIVLSHFRTAEIEKIFLFDYSENALVMKFENFLAEYRGLGKLKSYLKNFDQLNFRDIINISALWRPFRSEMIERTEKYLEAKKSSFSYGCLSSEIENWLKPNYGMIIYHEDLIRIISHATGWDFARSNSLRRLLATKKNQTWQNNLDWLEFNNLVPAAIVKLVIEESPWSFCMPHAISFSQFIKQTAVLKSLHPKEYYSEIESFEEKHGVTWDDIGIKIKGVSLHQS